MNFLAQKVQPPRWDNSYFDVFRLVYPSRGIVLQVEVSLLLSCSSEEPQMTHVQAPAVACVPSFVLRPPTFLRNSCNRSV